MEKKKITFKELPTWRKVLVLIIYIPILTLFLFLISSLFRGCGSNDTGETTSEENRPGSTGLKSNATMITRKLVKQKLQYAEDADFSIFSIESEDMGNDIYHIRGNLTAKTGIGVEKEVNYDYILEYKGGNPDDVSSWDVHRDNVKE